MGKRILFIFPYNTWGGAFRSSYILSNKLIERGWEVDIIFPIIPPRNGFKILSLNWLKLKIIGVARSLIRWNKVKIDCKANIKIIPWISHIWIKNYSSEMAQCQMVLLVWVTHKF